MFKINAHGLIRGEKKIKMVIKTGLVDILFFTSCMQYGNSQGVFLFILIKFLINFT